LYFPHPLTAPEDEPLAMGGDLSTERLILAYQHGIFPWYNEGPILWWFTHPRPVITSETLKVSKSMKQLMRSTSWKMTINHSFEEVIYHCAIVYRDGQFGTWITEDIIESYSLLHRLGIAHSVEVWENDKLIGGLYGVLIGEIFFGESMFAYKSNASKFGFLQFSQHLFSKGCKLIDCQQDTPHMRKLGTKLWSKENFWHAIQSNLIADTIVIQ
jgi:leucyl/phenylalanyl-tRNA--protein transferase